MRRLNKEAYAHLFKLRKGRRIYWNDPDNGACSRWLKIASVKLNENDYSFSIETKEGDVVEGLWSELSEEEN